MFTVRFASTNIIFSENLWVRVVDFSLLHNVGLSRLDELCRREGPVIPARHENAQPR